MSQIGHSLPKIRNTPNHRKDRPIFKSDLFILVRLGAEHWVGPSGESIRTYSLELISFNERFQNGIREFGQVNTTTWFRFQVRRGRLHVTVQNKSGPYFLTATWRALCVCKIPWLKILCFRVDDRRGMREDDSGIEDSTQMPDCSLWSTSCAFLHLLVGEIAKK